MKKLTTILLAMVLVLVFTLAGCSEQSATAYSLVKDAVTKTGELDSAHIKADVTVNMSMAGIREDNLFSMDVQASELKSGNALAAGKMTSKNDLSGHEFYLDKEYLYIKTEDAQVKVLRDKSPAVQYDLGTDVGALVKALPEEALRDVTVTKNEDGSQTVTADVSKEVFESMYGDLGSKLEKVVFNFYMAAEYKIGYTVNIDDVHVEITLPESGYVGQYTLCCKIKMDLSEELKEEGAIAADFDITVSMAFIDPGEEVTVTLPSDLDKYMSFFE